MHTVGESEMSSTGLNCTNSVEIPVDNFNSEAEPSCQMLMDEPEGSNLKQGHQVDIQSDLPENTAHFSPLESSMPEFKSFQFEFDNSLSHVDDTIQFYQSYSDLENNIVSDGDLDVYTVAATLNSSPLKPQMFEKWLRRYNWYEVTT